jgi:hypothetical protein
MKINRSWEIISGGSIGIRIKEMVQGGFRYPSVNISLLKLAETEGRDRKQFDGTFKVKKEDEPLLSKSETAQNFTISLEGEALPFKELEGCSIIGRGALSYFVAGNVNVLNNEPDVKIKKRTWELESKDPREIRLHGAKSDTLPSLTIKENDGEEYSIIPAQDSESRFERVGESFNVLFRCIQGEASPFKELKDCHKEEGGKRGYKVETENIIWAESKQ